MGWTHLNPRFGASMAIDEHAMHRLLDCATIHSAKSKPAVHVWPTTMTLNGSSDRSLEVYCKVYDYPRPSWRFFCRRSKARRERHSAEAFSRMGLRTADVIFCSEQRDWIGRLRRACIITRAISGACMLDVYVRRTAASACSPAARIARQYLLHELATMVATLHRQDFFHNDLHWRNVLVTESGEGRPMIWLIDCPRGRFRRWSVCKSHYRVKDLATLDRTAKTLCTMRERIRFARAYLRALGSRQSLRRLAARVERYRRRRWREKDAPQRTTAPSALPVDNPPPPC